MMNETGQDRALNSKIETVLESLRSLDSVVVAFSGGVDSALLASLARAAVGDRAVAALALSASLPDRERRAAEAVARQIGIELLTVETREMDEDRYVANDGDRCYWCRKAMSEALAPLAEARGAALVYGAISDDLGEDRPGMRAAEESGMRAPLLDAGLSKDEVRRAAQARGLSVWDKPAAACLSSRIAVGVPVSAERLARIERAEDGLLDLGLRVLRVRDHEDVARIEVGTDELMRLVEPELRQRIVETVRAAGYRHVTLDLEGYRPAGLLSVDSPRRTA